MKKEKYINRDDSGSEYIERKSAIGVHVVANSWDEKTRSIEVIASTEDPAMIYDPQRREVVEEVLLSSGCEFERSVPHTIEHNSYAGDVIGSFRDIRIENNQVVGRVYYASTEDAAPYATKVKEGHLDSFSVSYPSGNRDSVYIADGETGIVERKSYAGPILITKKWKLKALGLVMLGANERAKARSAGSPQKNKGDNEMNKELRAFLERSGLKNDATDAEAEEFMGRMGVIDPQATADAITNEPAAEPVVPIDIDATVQRAQQAERVRVTEIQEIGRKSGYDISAHVLSGDTVDVVRAKALQHMLDNPVVPDGLYREPAIHGADEKDKFRSAAEDGLVMRAGVCTIDKPAAGHDEIMGLSLTEIARHSLRIANQSVKGNKLEMVGRAMTTSDFPYILANVANKSLQAGWETEPETWKQWCATGSVSDFKTHSAVNVSEFSDLEEVPEDTEFHLGKRTESREQYAAVTYGRLGNISRQAVINDDLDAITSNYMGMGEAAARKIGDLPYSVLTANAAMGDSIALFHATHANYVASGAGAAIGTATMAAMVLAMGIQTDLQGLRKLNISPEFILAPKAMEGASETFFQSNNFTDTGTAATDSTYASTRANIYGGTRFKRIYEPRLDDFLSTGWYAAARKGKTVKVFFLNGVQTPFMEQQQGFTVDGMTYKVRIDAGAKAMDYRGLYYNYGA